MLSARKHHGSHQKQLRDSCAAVKGAVTATESEAKLDRTRPCASECKHEREVKLVMLELEKLREKIARLEGGISKGEMLYFKIDCDTDSQHNPDFLRKRNPDDLVEIIQRLQQEAVATGRLFVESKTQAQRLSAEVDKLKAEVTACKQEKELTEALYMDKLQRKIASCSLK